MTYSVQLSKLKVSCLLLELNRKLRNLRVRFPSGAQKHFSEFAIKLE